MKTAFTITGSAALLGSLAAVLIFGPNTFVPAPPHLSIALTNLPGAFGQPASDGQWNQATGEFFIGASGVTNARFLIYCGPTIAVRWLTETNALYECQASTDGVHWLGSSMLIIGTGSQVTLYDYFTSGRLYRVVATAQ